MPRTILATLASLCTGVAFIIALVAPEPPSLMASEMQRDALTFMLAGGLLYLAAAVVPARLRP